MIFLTFAFLQYYGSSTVRHYSDFGGGQMVMDRLLLKKRSLTSSLSKLTNNTKRESRPSRCILVFTAFEMKMMNSDKEVRNRMALILFQFS